MFKALLHCRKYCPFQESKIMFILNQLSVLLVKVTSAAKRVAETIQICKTLCLKLVSKGFVVYLTS